MADAASLFTRVDALIDEVECDSEKLMRHWSDWDIDSSFLPSAKNLADYLAFRHHDLRNLQRELMVLGLSSLGRLESRVMPTLSAVRTALAAMNGMPSGTQSSTTDFFAGEARLDARARALFGQGRRDRSVALLVTCPSEAGEDPAFMRGLAQRGVEALRINCAHDGPETWARMIANARKAEAESGHHFKLLMDLAGPKVRTGAVRAWREAKHVFAGDRLAMVAPGELDRPVPEEVAFTFECELPEAVAAVHTGQHLMIDDGKITACVDALVDGAVLATVVRVKEGGAKLQPEKGVNLPDTELAVPVLTGKDREDLAFIAANADGVEFSFVQNAADVELLQEALAEIRPDDWMDLALILKVETARAVRNLPEIVVRAAARQPVAVMIARGDLAIEIGFARLAEMQEEILWIAEAAQVPVIWATQVLEHLVKEGMPNRGELTDAAMASRAECVMLNKGPYLFEAIDALEPLLGRMGEHVHKKTPQLRRLKSW